MFIDADAHVDESTETWSYFPKKMEHLRPAEMVFVEGQQPGFIGKLQRALLIDGEIAARRTRIDSITQTTVDTRELYDVPARLKHMDELGIETQVLYPSVMLDEITQRPEVEVALCESYNRWIADRCSESGGRLRFTACLPLRSMSDALKELKRARDDGAVAIFKRSIESGNRRAGDAYFYPLYELAQELDIPLCFHIARPYAGNTTSFTATGKGMLRTFHVQDAFLSLLTDEVDIKFPRLRFGFIEAASGWLPYLLWLAKLEGWNEDRKIGKNEMRAHLENILEESRMFVTCEAMEDLPDLLSRVGDSHLMVGSDYGHSDRTALIHAHQVIIDQADVDPKSALKLTDENARGFYGL